MPMRLAIGEVARSCGPAPRKCARQGARRIIVVRSPRLACVLEVMRAILQAGGDGETFRIVSRIELPAFLSDKGGGALLA